MSSGAGIYVTDHPERSWFLNCLSYRYLVRNLVARHLKVRYKRSIIGFGWALLNPLASMLVFYMVFSRVFGMGTSYALYVIIGILFWQLFSLGTLQGIDSLLASGSVVRKISVPKAVFPLSGVMANLVNFCLSLIPLLLCMVMFKAPLGVNLLWVPVSIAILFIFTLGVTFGLSALSVFFRDVRYFYETGLLVWFYATPIIFPAEIVPDRYRFLLHLNPLYPLLDTFRTPLYSGLPPSPDSCVLGIFFAAAALLFGWQLFRVMEPRFLGYL